jgi:hypothetical protein
MQVQKMTAKESTPDEDKNEEINHLLQISLSSATDSVGTQRKHTQTRQDASPENDQQRSLMPEEDKT